MIWLSSGNKHLITSNKIAVGNCWKLIFRTLFKTRGGLVSIPQCIAVLDHCIHIINSPAQLAQCSLAVVVNTSQKIYRFRKWRIFFAPGMGLKLLFWKQWNTSSDLCLLRPHSVLSSAVKLTLVSAEKPSLAMQFFYQLWMAR